jgi:uncharacterized protein
VCAAAGQAVDWKALQPQGYVSDFAGVVPSLQPKPARSLLRRRRAIDRRANGAGHHSVARRRTHRGRRQHHFPRLGRGPEGQERGHPDAAGIHDRRSRLEVGYGLEPILPDGLSGSILRQMRPALRQGDYGDAMLAAAETIGNTIAQAKHVTFTATCRGAIGPCASDSIPWPMILGGIFLLFWLLRAERRAASADSAAAVSCPADSG